MENKKDEVIVNSTINSVNILNRTFWITSSWQNVSHPTDVVPDRRLDTVLAASLSFISLYLVVATCIYYYKHSSENIKNTNRIINVCAFVLLVETCWFQTEIQLKRQVTVTFCRIYTIVNLLLSIGNKTLVYIVLWIRLSSFYKSSTFIGIPKNKFNFLSLSLLVVILLTSLGQIFVLAAFPVHKGKFGCKSGPPSEPLDVITPAAFTVFCFLEVILFK